MRNATRNFGQIVLMVVAVSACGHSTVSQNATLPAQGNAVAAVPPDWAAEGAEWGRMRIGYTPVVATMPTGATLMTQPVGTNGDIATVGSIAVGNWGLAVFVAAWPTYERRDAVRGDCASAMRAAARNIAGFREASNEVPVRVHGFDGCMIHYSTSSGVEGYGQTLIGRGFFVTSLLFVPEGQPNVLALAHRFLDNVELDSTEAFPVIQASESVDVNAEQWPYYFADINGMAARVPGNLNPVPGHMPISGGSTDFDVDAYVLEASTSRGTERYTLAAGTRPAGVTEENVNGHVSDVVRRLEGCALREAWDRFPQAYHAHNAIYDCDNRTQVLYVRQIHVQQWVYETTAQVSHEAEAERRVHLLEQLESLRVFF